jgi:hypothetical protein
MSNKLPSLPEPTMQINMAEYIMGLQVYSTHQMHAYGQKCRDAALEEATQLMEEQDTQAPKHNAKAIRAMKEQII